MERFCVCLCVCANAWNADCGPWEHILFWTETNFRMITQIQSDTRALY